MNRSLSDLGRDFSERDLSSFPGSRQQRREVFESFFSNLHEGKLVFHDQFTALVEVVEMELTSRGFEMEVRSLATLKRWDRGVIRTVPGRWRFGNTWEFCTLHPGACALKNHPVGFCLWLEPDLVRRVEQLVTIRELQAIEDLLWGPTGLKTQVA